ncbi:DNA polymerase III subunit alpha [Vulcanococcus limneticus Candia 3F8]|uniref:DNA polymerase III subunit alpha n=1 Tax=Vulcanococcus limneticus TaxID=2170428 RepID=UPI000B98066A|nr:DNA polymerase III subunit alpha [Vulcanococcus limneticus]MCP9791518.1 DNA polymerase III subunit alpha [Vulcanococcus limneticus MW73D5]MCP9893189.1 DNA polymerase III subunit alpha [Vulcanococcus limneticus Candia 3F8]MCP9896908.1 DNA polymerase III subunit alpha [Vulcanococcus limneticus Candia 3B3]
MAFVPLHNHSDYSLLDGASQLPAMVKRAEELGFPALALTDHGVMYGAIELLKLCKGTSVKPIIGNEMYVINGSLDDPNPPKKERRYHLVVLAKNAVGYRNLVKLTSISHLRGMRGRGIFSRACIDKPTLERHSEGLIVATACLGGEIPQAILKDRPDVARDVARWYQGVFGDDFYLEIQDHGSPEDRIVNVEMARISKELGIPLIATNDAHYLTRNDVEAHDALLCVLTGKLVTDEKRLRYTGTEYIKSEAQMLRLFADHLEPEVVADAVANTAKVAEKVEDYDILGRYQMPRFPIPEGHTPVSYLREVSEQGLRVRLELPEGAPFDSTYGDRLAFELQVMEQMGFPTYFLVVWDYIRFARESGIPVGPGRGSAAGSLVAYALGITNIDPVTNGLLFERFLNPERKSMPDIDTDFCIERRGEVIDYVTRRYGEDKVAQIITFNRMTSKAVLKDVARVLDIPYGDADRLAKLIPVVRGKPAKLKEMIGPESPAPEFREKYENDPQVKRWVEMAMRIEGTNKTFGVHAAGVVIAADPLDEVVPLQRNNDGQVITQYFMEDVESMGLLKMDFLGLKNLTMIDKTLDLVEQSSGVRVDPDKLPLDDPGTFGLLARGDLEGIFQLESSGMRQIVRDLKPSSLEDISSILALYRPGPLDAGLIPKFINRKHGREAIDFVDAKLEPILTETYGIMVYQEQIMRIAQDLAGYSLGEADLLRRAMGKKKKSEMEKHQGLFVKGATERGVDPKVAEGLFEQMVLFAEYCFNKSHSTAYGAVTYQTAYLKAHYPVAYMAALLTVNAGATDKVQRYIANANAMGIEVMPPDVNASGTDFTPVGERILFGLSAVRNLGDGAIRALLENRQADGPFRSLADLCDRLPGPTLNRRALESLIHCGAMDGLEPNANRAQLMADLDLILDWASSRARDRASGQGNLFDLLGGGASGSTAEAGPAAPGGADPLSTAPKAAPVSDYPPTEKLRLEKELVGFYLSDHPLKQLTRPIRLLSAVGLGSLEEQADKARVSVVGMVSGLRPVVTRKGDRMAVLQLEDLTGSCEAVVFPKTYARLADHLMVDARLLIWASVDRRDEQVQLIVDDCRVVDELKFLLVELAPEEASDIAVQHKLRECLNQHRTERDEAGVRVPVVALVRHQNETRYVRLGHQFCVNDSQAALSTLTAQAFRARLSAPLVAA